MKREEYAEGIETMLKRRTKQFALSVIRLVQRVPRSLVGDVLARQLIRSATSVGANYRSACRGKSKADMAAKLAIAEEEADESLYWLDLLIESGTVPAEDAGPLVRDGEEILRVLVASIRTLKLASSQQPIVRETVKTYRTNLDDLREAAVAEALSLGTPNSKVESPKSKVKSSK